MLLKLHLRSVEKSMYVPASRLNNMLDVYGMLGCGLEGGIPGAAKPSFDQGVKVSCVPGRLFYWRGFEAICTADIEALNAQSFCVSITCG